MLNLTDIKSLPNIEVSSFLAGVVTGLEGSVLAIAQLSVVVIIENSAKQHNVM